MSNLAKKLITFSEYLEYERNSPEKHEFYKGEIFAMAGATENHNLIVSNLIIIFGTIFKNRSCVVYPSDMKVAIDKNNHYTYPDVTIVCGDRKFLDDKKDVLLNPNIIIEVLSDSTEVYDRGKKFESYRSSDSLGEYVLVSSNRKKVELFSKDSNAKWYFSESDDYEQIVIPTLSVTLNLQEVYAKVEFT